MLPDPKLIDSSESNFDWLYSKTHFWGFTAASFWKFLFAGSTRNSTRASSGRSLITERPPYFSNEQLLEVRLSRSYCIIDYPTSLSCTLPTLNLSLLDVLEAQQQMLLTAAGGLPLYGCTIYTKWFVPLPRPCRTALMYSDFWKV